MTLDDRALLISLQIVRLNECIGAWKKAGFPDFAGYKTEKNGGANRTAIRRQILEIRQQLLALDREVGGK